MFVHLAATEGLSERVVMKPGNYKQWRKFEGKKDEQEATNNKKTKKDCNVDMHGYCNLNHTKWTAWICCNFLILLLGGNLQSKISSFHIILLWSAVQILLNSLVLSCNQKMNWDSADILVANCTVNIKLFLIRGGAVIASSPKQTSGVVLPS